MVVDSDDQDTAYDWEEEVLARSADPGLVVVWLLAAAVVRAVVRDHTHYQAWMDDMSLDLKMALHLQWSWKDSTVRRHSVGEPAAVDAVRSLRAGSAEYWAGTQTDFHHRRSVQILHWTLVGCMEVGSNHDCADRSPRWRIVKINK